MLQFICNQGVNFVGNFLLFLNGLPKAVKLVLSVILAVVVGSFVLGTVFGIIGFAFKLVFWLISFAFSFGVFLVIGYMGYTFIQYLMKKSEKSTEE